MGGSKGRGIAGWIAPFFFFGRRPRSLRFVSFTVLIRSCGFSGRFSPYIMADHLRIEFKSLNRVNADMDAHLATLLVGGTMSTLVEKKKKLNSIMTPVNPQREKSRRQVFLTF